jgi:biopolymer transport protein ExbB/TolQ
MNSTVFLRIEIGITLFIVLIQFAYFFITIAKTRGLKRLFPRHELSKENVKTIAVENAEEVEIISIEEVNRPEFQEIVDSINRYLINNKGVADFEIMKSNVERSVDRFHEAIVSQINVPMYIGLMGTFVGVVVGLFNIGFRGGVSEDNINSFIGGVLIAMIASFIGLLLTVVSNAYIYRKGKAISERGKDAFLKFLEVDVLPYSGSGLADVVSMFRDNISKFNTSFGRNIKSFDEKLSYNISSLDKPVSLLANNITSIVDNTQSNYRILELLQSSGFQQMTAANLKLIEAINNTVPNINEFIKKQQELNIAIEKTAMIVSTIEGVLNRVKRFEESINNLGSKIDNADYLGSDLLIKVNKKLEELDSQFALIKQHSQTTSGQIEVHLEAEKQKIDLLSAKILSELRDAMEFKTGKNPFTKLDLLESIDKNLNDIQNRQIKQLSSDLNYTKDYIKDIQENISFAVNNKSSMYDERRKKPSHQPKSKWRTLFGLLKDKRGREE